MQKIFILDPEDSISIKLDSMNKILEDGGKVISVTSNIVSSGSSSHYGSWLLVIDDGKLQNLKV